MSLCCFMAKKKKKKKKNEVLASQCTIMYMMIAVAIRLWIVLGHTYLKEQTDNDNGLVGF